MVFLGVNRLAVALFGKYEQEASQDWCPVARHVFGTIKDGQRLNEGEAKQVKSVYFRKISNKKRVYFIHYYRNPDTLDCRQYPTRRLSMQALSSCLYDGQM